MPSGYHTGWEWARFVRYSKPIIRATLPSPCVNQCGRLVHDQQRWHVGHLPGHDRALTHEPPTLQTVGPAHGRCNEQAGQKLGQQLRQQRYKVVSFGLYFQGQSTSFSAASGSGNLGIPPGPAGTHAHRPRSGHADLNALPLLGQLQQRVQHRPVAGADLD